MEHLFKNKKLLFIAGVLFLFIIAILIILFTAKKPEGGMTNLTQTPSRSPIISYPTYPQAWQLSESTLPTPPANWVPGDNPAYSIKFPPDWKPTITSVVGGGTNVVLQPSASNYFPRFDIEAAPANPDTPVEKRIEQLKGLTPSSFSESRITFREMPVIQITEILPITDMQGNPVNKTYLFFTKNNITYVITFAYLQDSNADTNKQILLQILNSIALK